MSSRSRLGPAVAPAAATASLLRPSPAAQRGAGAIALQRSVGNAATAAIVSRAPRRILARFDPKWHRSALLSGLKDVAGFTSGDLGAIYAGNWERDFSQAHPALGAVVLAWKDLQRAKSEGRPLDAPAVRFRSGIKR